MLLKKVLMIGCLLFMSTTYAKDMILVKAGDVQIIQQNCNENTYECDYVKKYKGKSELLIEKWSKTVIPYQFSPNLIGLRLGATGSNHILEIYDSNDKKSIFYNVIMVDEQNKCFLNQESDGEKHQKIAFYRLPSLQVFFEISSKNKDFRDFKDISSKYIDEEDNSFNFDYSRMMDNEVYFQQVKILDVCGHMPKIIQEDIDDSSE